MNVAEALREASKQLAEWSDTARLDAELLMASALVVSRSELLIWHMDKPVPDQFNSMIARRKTHEPIAYILGAQEFYGRSFKVTPDVLIPRGDSETVVDAALEQLPESGPARILDLGTGSGALLLTLLAERPACSGLGIDRSVAALRVAQSNARKLDLSDRADFREGDWNDDADGIGWADGLGDFDLIIANPPYVEASAELKPDVERFEPKGALFAGRDGLDDYRTIIPQLSEITAKTVVLEIGASQADQICSMALRHGFSCKVRKDLANRPRAVVLRQ